MSIAPLRKKYLGEILIANNLVTKEQLKDALTEQQETKEKLGAILLKRGYVTEDVLLRSLAESFRIPMMRLEGLKIDDNLSKILPEKMAKKFMAMPVSVTDNILKVAMTDPTNMAIIDEIEAETRHKVSIVLASEKEIRESIEKFYSGGVLEDVKDAPDDAIKDEEISGNDAEAAESAPIIKYVNSLLYEAVTKTSSDIHIEPAENGVFIRMRIDGNLKEFAPPPRKFLSAIVSRIKIMANLDIAERRLPQDGKCKIKINNKKIDVRVSTMPTLYGEKIVLRILDRSNLTLSIESLGYSKEDTAKFMDSIQRPYGMILVTGPTGSGKTTTLYTGLNFINTPEKNIVTVEDPVEYELKGVNQVQTRSNIGLTFASILRAVLRQDPDVIMVGEIRDKETAEIAVQAALTGHLVLSTLHTNDAVSSLSRLAYMGIEPILIADAVDMVVAQRLIRKICPLCKQKVEIPEIMVERLKLRGENMMFYHGTGCDNCNGTGYKGRTTVHEILKLTNNIKKLILSGEGDIIIKELAIKEGMRTLRQTAIDKLREGVTTVEEVLSVTSAAS